MKEKISLNKIIRVVTTAPIMAFVLLTVLYFFRGDIFRSIYDYIWAVVFLTILPIMAYPIQPIVPGFRDKGRTGQRNLAIIMAVLGYIAGIIYAVVSKAPDSLLFIYMTYLISGLLIALFNKVLKIRASGHACGVAGPVALLGCTMGWYAVFGLPLIAIVFAASLKMKRHTFSELVIGSLIAVFSVAIGLLIM